LPKILTPRLNRNGERFFFDCAGLFAVSSPWLGTSRRIAMIETVTAFFGVVSASIFLAHALEAYRSRPQPALLKRSGGFSGRGNH
jgi:hypothetical protein